MLWIYYAFIKTNTYLLITIYSLGCVIEIIYITMYIMYATKSARIYTAKIFCLINLGLFGLIVIATFLFADGSKRLIFVGWICVGFSVSIYVAPLSIIIPNTLGFAFCVVQMVLYVIYMDRGQKAIETKESAVEHIVDISKLGSTPDLELKDLSQT